jgi:hypothetical protein
VSPSAYKKLKSNQQLADPHPQLSPADDKLPQSGSARFGKTAAPSPQLNDLPAENGAGMVIAVARPSATAFEPTHDRRAP